MRRALRGAAFALSLPATLCHSLCGGEEGESLDCEDLDNDIHSVQLVQANEAYELSHNLRSKSLLSARLAHRIASTDYGRAGCPCIGIEWAGSAWVPTNGTLTTYPAAVGSSCDAWDRGRHPSCRGSSPPEWCGRPWCLVDGCNCNLATPPKVSSYFPNATYQSHPVYYSYATCGATDVWTAENSPGACVNQLTEAACSGNSRCAWEAGRGCLGKELVEGCSHLPSDAVTGSGTCKCIGLSDLNGTVMANIRGGSYPYPSEFGSYCDAWDEDRHPDCGGSVDPFWCSQKWCYVDPCSCRLDITPKRLTYIPDATYQGKPLFYSYRTCGEQDSYSRSENAEACPNYPSEFQCRRIEGCIWANGNGCVSTAIVETCGWEAFGAATRLSGPLLMAGAGLAMLVLREF